MSEILSLNKIRGASAPRGFSLIEIMVVMVVGSILLSLAAVTFSSYNQRTAARRAAQVFSRDLTLARSHAVRGRERVVIRFDELASDYLVTTAAGRDLAYRRFGVGGEFRLSAVDLVMPGDSLSFSSRGFADLTGLGKPLGTAIFTGGNVAYQVEFNSMGASKVGAL